jgi:hypothetical protein
MSSTCLTASEVAAALDHDSGLVSLAGQTCAPCWLLNRSFANEAMFFMP